MKQIMRFQSITSMIEFLGSDRLIPGTTFEECKAGLCSLQLCGVGPDFVIVSCALLPTAGRLCEDVSKDDFSGHAYDSLGA